jgi:membrane protein implicated in regulation of membrane protease activity
MNWAACIWLILLVVFLAVEASTVTMVSLWFAAGALVALFTGLLGGPLWLQVRLFLAVSTLSLVALRPLFRKFIRPKLTATNVDSVIGATGLVTVSVDNVSAVGQVKLGAMEWTARSTSGVPIEAGTLVRVDRIEGVKVFVSPAEVPANVR